MVSKKSKLKREVIEWTKKIIMITIGACIMAFGLEVVLLPNNLMDGGVVGISIMVSKLTNIGLSVLIILLSIPFIAIGYYKIGKDFAIATTYGIIVLATVSKLLHHTEPLTQVPFLAVVYGGVLLGVGIVIKNGGALDGSEVLAVLFNHKTPFSVGEIILFMNLFIFIVAGLLFEYDTAAYSLVAYYITFKTIDIVQVGLSESKSIHIISQHHKEISKEITKQVASGVTFLNAKGAFGDKKEVLWLVITRLEESKVLSIIDDIDEHAFVTVADIAEVRGGRFKKNKH
jgi:uncharacterized membrane-anchored protein YitT (DUF2179 family)